MEPKLPSWVDEQYLGGLLQGSIEKGPKVKVLKFSSSLAVAPGDNFLSHIFRIHVDCQKENSGETSVTLFAKIPIENDNLNNILDKGMIFDNEIGIYNEMLPLMKNITGFDFGPKYYHSNVKNIVVVEDLCPDGYSMCDRHEQLNYQQCEAVLKLLAKFHAGSVPVIKDHPDFIDRFGQELFYTKSAKKYQDEIKPWLENSVKIVAAMISNIEGCEPAANEFMDRADAIADSVCDLMCTPKASALSVLNHGDMWTCNVLFKYNDAGDIVGTKFIDFQITRYGSPVADLLYFLWTSANKDVREHNMNKLIEVYCQELNRCLEKFGCRERLPLETFLNEIKLWKDWSIVCVTSGVAVVICDKGNTINTETYTPDDLKIEEAENIFKKMFESKHYQEMMSDLIKQYQNFYQSLL